MGKKPFNVICIVQIERVCVGEGEGHRLRVSEGCRLGVGEWCE